MSEKLWWPGEYFVGDVLTDRDAMESNVLGYGNHSIHSYQIKTTGGIDRRDASWWIAHLVVWDGSQERYLGDKPHYPEYAEYHPQASAAIAQLMATAPKMYDALELVQNDPAFDQLSPETQAAINEAIVTALGIIK